jgi:DNA polymerase V
MFALADCNNFYASCERVFNPALRNRPVVVLSNNDGCVIARSSEAKQLGIRMGVPAFQIEKLLSDHHVAVFSSNYALYGDLSLRVMNTLASFVPSMEIYSIDEAFLDFSGIAAEKILPLAQEIRKTVMRDTGIPVGIGIAPTKTLAKIANHVAKKTPDSVCFLKSDEEIMRVLKETPVGDIWGIGKQYASLLNRHGIETAYDLSKAPDNWIKKNLTVVGLRTKKELAGISFLSLDEVVPDKKAICTSRSFGQPQTELTELEEAVSTFAVRCAEKLRRQQSAASQIMVFIHTNAFRSDLPQYARNRVIDLPSPTNSSIELVKHAVEALQSIYRKGYSYKKAGVIVTGLVPEQEIQQDLFSEARDNRHKKLMESMDEINRNSNRPLIQIATQGSGRKWKLRQEKLSPGYTTRWGEIMEIRV